MSYVVTSAHAISLPGGRMVGPGERVTGVKTSDAHIASLIQAGALTKKSASKPKPTAKPAETEEAVASPEKNETENN